MLNLEKELEEKIANAQSEEELLNILAEAGISTTLEELRAAVSADGELDEAALDNVSGGGALWTVIRKIFKPSPISPFRGGGGSAGGR